MSPSLSLALVPHLKISLAVNVTHSTKYFSYFNKVLPLWNKLSCHIDLDSSFPTIKSQIKRLFKKYFISNFNTYNKCNYLFLFNV